MPGATALNQSLPIVPYGLVLTLPQTYRRVKANGYKNVFRQRFFAVIVKQDASLDPNSRYSCKGESRFGDSSENRRRCFVNYDLRGEREIYAIHVGKSAGGRSGMRLPACNGASLVFLTSFVEPVPVTASFSLRGSGPGSGIVFSGRQWFRQIHGLGSTATSTSIVVIFRCLVDTLGNGSRVSYFVPRPIQLFRYHDRDLQELCRRAWLFLVVRSGQGLLVPDPDITSVSFTGFCPARRQHCTRATRGRGLSRSRWTTS